MALYRSKKTISVGLHWLALCVAVPACVAPGLSKFEFDPALLLALIVLMYCGTRLSILAAYGLNKAVELMFWLYCYTFFGISAFLQIAENKFPWPGQYSSISLFRGELIVLTGLIAFDMARPINPKTKLLYRPIHKPNFEISRARLYIVSAIGIMLMIYATYTLGGLETLILNRTALSSFISQRYNLSTSLILTVFAKTVVYVLLVIALALRLRSHKRTLPLSILIFVLGLSTALENNPVSTARFQVGTILLSIFFVLPWQRKFAWMTVYGMIMIMIVVFPYADLFRSSTNLNIVETIAHRESKENQLITKPDYDSYQQVVNGVRFVQQNGFQFGRQISGAFLFWVPRSMWSGKPIPTGQLIAEKMGYGFTNLSAPLWIEFFVDGGWLLLIVGFYGYGRMVRWLDHIRMQNARKITFVYLFATIYAGYQFFLLRGSLMPAVAYLSPVIPIILCCVKLKRSRMRVLSVGSKDVGF